MLIEAMRDLCGRLVMGGVRAVVDARDVNPPCVLVRPPIMHYRMAGGDCASMDWAIAAIVGDPGTEDALEQMSVLLEQVRAALDYEPVQAVPSSSLSLDNAPPLPCYLLTFST